MKTRPLNARPRLPGFTLIEIMIVISIAAMVMAIGIPAIFSALKKDALRQAISDVVEACSQARAHAIISGYPTEIVFQPLDYTFNIGMAAIERSSDDAPGGGTISLPANDGGRGALPPPSFSRQLSDQLVIEMLSVNFVEFKEEEKARVRFYPNGTCDEFTIVLQWPQTRAYRKISLDIITGLADVEVIR
jgi:prepilin-type N-terminal cleavage/methylation domain-containing protein